MHCKHGGIFENVGAINPSERFGRRFTKYTCLDITRVIELLEILQRCPEIQPAKLAALQKILQSDFCNMVREVYEHVYATVDINGSEEVRTRFFETAS